MENDKELLELAAKALGDLNIRFDARGGCRWVGRNEDLGCDVVSSWNPLDDNGDAFELMVKCDIHIDRAEYELTAFYLVGDFWNDLKVDIGDDPLAATRRAIVRAAAEIGRRM